MLTENRKYDFVGELTLKRSRVLSEHCQPKEDTVNWLFLKDGERQFSFVYKIQDPSNAKYGESFRISLSFTMKETVERSLEIGHIYKILRGEEEVGIVNIISVIR
jgi:hypothetical protein